LGTETFYQRLAKLTRLPGALREAGFIGGLLSIAPRVGAAATEAVVRSSPAPWVLHIASHGLFLGGESWAGAGGRSAPELAQRKGVLFGDFATESLKINGDPDALSRSALVLAGAARGDQAKSAAEDGLLTGDEAQSLDLRGTQLVVLSACGTGQGELSVGQGVYGMRRSFLVAGAETLVSSLWQVSDEATGKLMEVYYQKLLVEKKGRLEAMQEAMQQMREQYRHPYYWAPFQVIGSDGPLRPPANLAQR
jgi:CHAT domain-containing protein